MAKTGDYDATLVTYRNSPRYTYLEEEVKGLNVAFVRNAGKFLYAEVSVLKYLFTESKKIEVLNLFHFKRGNVLYLLVYKILNPKGQAYVKLDIDLMFFRRINNFFYSNYTIKHYLLKLLTQIHFKLTDLFSIETEEAREYILKVYPELKEKLICIPNGIDDHLISRCIPRKNFNQKENVIITVGRIGTEQKNTELFLETIRLTDLKDWKVYIVGPIDETFKDYLSGFFDNNPGLKAQIFFTGNINDRKELYAFYNRAKIFCMTSRFEGFPIAFAEASYFGNYIITTPVSSSSYVTDNGRLGQIVEAEPELMSEALQKAISGEFLTKELYQEITTFAAKNLTWKNIIKRLAMSLASNAKTTA